MLLQDKVSLLMTYLILFTVVINGEEVKSMLCYIIVIMHVNTFLCKFFFIYKLDQCCCYAHIIDSFKLYGVPACMVLHCKYGYVYVSCPKHFSKFG